METAGTQEAGVREQFIGSRATIGLPWRLSIFAVILFALALFSYVGLRFGYRVYLESQLDTLSAELENLAAQVSADEQEQFLVLYSQILHLKTALDGHFFTANTLPFLERNVVSGVVFSGASFAADSLLLKVNGTAPAFDALAAQMAVFEQAGEVKSITLEKVSITGGAVNFSLLVTMTPEAFVQQTVPQSL